MKGYQAAINEIIETAKKWKALLATTGKNETHATILSIVQLRYYQNGDNYFQIEIANLVVHLKYETKIEIKNQLIFNLSKIREIARLFAKSYEEYSVELSDTIKWKKEVLNNQRENKLKELSVIDKQLENVNRADTESIAGLATGAPGKIVTRNT